MEALLSRCRISNYAASMVLINRALFPENRLVKALFAPSFQVVVRLYDNTVVL